MQLIIILKTMSSIENDIWNVEIPERIGDWTVYTHTSESVYFYNKTSGKTTWEPPEEYNEYYILSNCIAVPRATHVSEKANVAGRWDCLRCDQSYASRAGAQAHVNGRKCKDLQKLRVRCHIRQL